MGTLARNAILTDPETGARRVLKAGVEVDDATAALLDPRAFGAPERLPVSAPAPVGDGVPLRALRSYAEGRGLTVPAGASGFDILDQLVDADARLSAAADADNDGDEPDVEAKRIAEVLEGKVDEVNGYLEEHPEDVAAVLAAEAAGQARKGITEGPYAQQQE